MSSTASAPWRRRPVAVASAALLAVAGAVAVLLIDQQSVSGTDGGGSTTFSTVGDGSLPTSKPKLGSGRDPLSAQEVGYAIHLASTDSSVPASARDVLGEQGPEVLYADLPDEAEASSARTAVVVLYDYASDTTYNQTVDLETGAVESQHAKKLQPPTSSTEADAAIAVAIESGKALTFVKEFEESQGVPLISPEQVDYVAGAWAYDATTKTGKECGPQRCAQLMVSTPTGEYLNTFDFVVNLSTKSIVAIK